jgi:hypothetical protein
MRQHVAARRARAVFSLGANIFAMLEENFSNLLLSKRLTPLLIIKGTAFYQQLS